MSTTSISVELRRVEKRFGSVAAVENVSLTVGHGEFLTLLGPSGCGKTTTLRLIAGFESPSGGEVLIGGQAVQNLPAYKRPVNTVFQNYALFPHLSVLDNVAFGLRMKRVPAEERRRRAAEALGMVRLEGMERRKPAQLSGGQQQRVALARALANRPSVLLLDEPLGALDLKLRRAMQIELRRLNREVGITFIYVTHDQEEALAMSDRIAVMSQGRMLQVGTAEEIYEHPTSRFVADFIGETNLLPGRIVSVADGIATVELPGGGAVRGRAGTAGPGAEVTLAVRPERVAITPAASENTRSGNALAGAAVARLSDMLAADGHDGMGHAAGDPAPTSVSGAMVADTPATGLGHTVSSEWSAGLGGTLAEAVYLGSSIQYIVALPDGTRVTVRRPVAAGDTPLAPGAPVSLSWAPADATILTA